MPVKTKREKTPSLRNNFQNNNLENSPPDNESYQKGIDPGRAYDPAIFRKVDELPNISEDVVLAPPDEREAEFGEYLSLKRAEFARNIPDHDALEDAMSKFNRKVRKFQVKMRGKEKDPNLQENNWIVDAEYLKWRDKFFSDYSTIVSVETSLISKNTDTKTAIIKGQISTALSNLRIALNSAGKDQGKAREALTTAKSELSIAEYASAQATQDLSGHVPEKTNAILPEWTPILKSYQKLVDGLSNNYDEISKDASRLQALVAGLSKQEEMLNELNQSGSSSSLIAIQAQAKALEAIVSQTNIPSESGQDRASTLADPAAFEQESQGLKDKSKSLDQGRIELLGQDPYEKDPSKLSDGQVRLLTAIVFAEGAKAWYLRKIAWIYMNKIQQFGFEKALRYSCAFNSPCVGDMSLPIVLAPMAKFWLYVMGFGDQYADHWLNESRNQKIGLIADARVERDNAFFIQADRLYRFIREVAVPHPEDNPIPSFHQQGYYNDLNRSPNVVQEWYTPQARLYLYLWSKEKAGATTPEAKAAIDAKYSKNMIILGRGSISTFLWDAEKGAKFLQKEGHVDAKDKKVMLTEEVGNLHPEIGDRGNIKLGYLYIYSKQVDQEKSGGKPLNKLGSKEKKLEFGGARYEIDPTHDVDQGDLPQGEPRLR